MPGDVASVLPAVPATQTVLPAACQDPLCPLASFSPFIAPNGADGEKQPIYVPFYNGKMARILAHKNGEFHLFDETKFLYTYMGVFWSEATPIFTTIFCRMTRVVKIVPMFQTMVNFIFFPLIGKMVKFIFFSRL